MRIYKQSIPPGYGIEVIKNDMVVFYGTEDIMTVPEDIEKLIAVLSNKTKVIKLKGYNHLDFVLSKTIRNDISLIIANILKSRK